MTIAVSVSTDAPSAAVTIHVTGPASRTVHTGGAVHGQASFGTDLSVPPGRYTITATVTCSSGTVTTNPSTLEV